MHSAFLVREKGFEPPTFWFVAKHSIQLSYSRISPFPDDSIIIAQFQKECKCFFDFFKKLFGRWISLENSVENGSQPVLLALRPGQVGLGIGGGAHGLRHG